jgi:capsular exopolysaccharide synthesis family protein
MGILSKAIRKTQAVKARPEAVEPAGPPAVSPPKPVPRADGASPVPSAPPPAAPERPRQAPAGSPGKPATNAAGPRPAPALATALALNRGAAGAAAAAASPAPAAASPQPAAEAPAQAPAAPEPPAAARPVPGQVSPDLVSLVNPEGPEAELFKLLRTRILFPQSGHPPRTILVTSALAEEGKSFVAANLAVNIARNVDEHVLLVDCDLRKPSIHAKFGYNGVQGLSEFLSAGLELPSLLVKTGVAKLTLLPSGASPSNPSELISSSRMAGLIEELKARYDDRYIILDSPPPMMAPETSAIAKWADGILVVVRHGTPMSLVEELVAHLDREKIIGVVINRVHQREFRRYSYKKYYNKYKSYQKMESA